LIGQVRHRILPSVRAARTRVSSKGQIVIPAWVRRSLDLQPGDTLSVEISPAGDRAITLRSEGTRDIDRALRRGYRWLETRGPDLVEALHDARRTARARERRRRRR